MGKNSVLLPTTQLQKKFGMITWCRVCRGGREGGGI